MKYLLFLSLFSLLFLSMNLVLSAFCCKEGPGLPERCWASGICCKKGTPEEYWDPTGCLEVWVEPASMIFTVGRKTPINLYIRTTYSDNYVISYKIIEGNSALIQVDLTGASLAENVNPGETRVLHPRVTVLASNAQGKILFNVTSQSETSLYKNTTLKVKESSLPVSLPEFDFNLFLISLWILIIFILKNKKSIKWEKSSCLQWSFVYFFLFIQFLLKIWFVMLPAQIVR